MDIPSEFLRRYIASAINVIIQISRLADGKRKIVSIQEITGMEGQIITMQEIFAFNQTGIDGQGNVKGSFKFQGVRPKFLEKFKVSGIQLQKELFDPDMVFQV
jgi:pilus assembly protein CpaF